MFPKDRDNCKSTMIFRKSTIFPVFDNIISIETSVTFSSNVFNVSVETCLHILKNVVFFLKAFVDAVHLLELAALPLWPQHPGRTSPCL